jgi:hypothetical protein
MHLALSFLSTRQHLRWRQDAAMTAAMMAALQYKPLMKCDFCLAGIYIHRRIFHVEPPHAPGRLAKKEDYCRQSCVFTL